MKRTGLYTAIIMVSFVLCAVSCAQAASKFAAKVNGVGIKNTKLDAAVDNFIENQKLMGMEVKEEDRTGLRKDILEKMLVTTELLYQESKKARLGSFKEEVEQQFEKIKGGFASKEEFEKVLKDRGITKKDLREDITRGVYIDRFLEKNIYSNIIISEAEKKQEYEKSQDKFKVPEQVKASHILIRIKQDAGDKDKSDAEKKIKDLRGKAMAGEDFAELARENSEDGSAPSGGDIGFFKKGDTVKSFEDAAFSLKKGEISDIVETQFGYHVIKVLDKTPARKLTYSEIEKEIGRFLLSQRKAEKLEKFVEGLRKTANIKYY